MKSLLPALVLVLAAVGCSPAATSPTGSHGSPDPTESTSPSANPAPLAQISPSAPGSPAVTPTQGPPHRPSFEPGAVLTTVSDRLRVRSKPSTADDSARYEPLLPIGTMLHAIEGPVAGSGYWWYRVELTEGQMLFDDVREGWVAAAAKDGSSWIDVHFDITPGPTFPPVNAGWPSVRVGDVSLQGDFEHSDTGALELRIEIRGRLPGSVEFATARGDDFTEWYCGGGPAGELGAGVTQLDVASGTADVTTEIRVGQDGVGKATIHLPASAPTEACPEDYPGPMVPMSGRWSDVQVTMPEHGLQLSLPTYEWADTF
jgi:hypothetical protein